MVFAFLKKYPEIAPLIVIVGTGCVAATVFMIRQATKNPEACWDKKNNPHPWLNIKHNEQVKLIPLFGVVGVGCVGAAFYLTRLAVKNPDACWDRKNNPYPWQNIKHNERLKFYSTFDYKTLENKRPDVAMD